MKKFINAEKKIESGVVSEYKKIEDKFVKAFLTPDDTKNNEVKGETENE